MQIKEYEAYTLKECLQQVRNDLGPDAVILETRKFRKGGLMGMGAKDAVCIVAATGITVHNDPPQSRGETVKARSVESRTAAPSLQPTQKSVETIPPPKAASAPSSSAAAVAARSVYGRPGARSGADREPARSTQTATRGEAFGGTATATSHASIAQNGRETGRDEFRLRGTAVLEPETKAEDRSSRSARSTMEPCALPAARATVSRPGSEPVTPNDEADTERLTYLERAMHEIRDCLTTLQREQREGHDRTVSAVVSAVAPAISAVSAAGFAAYAEELAPRFPELQQQLLNAGVSEDLMQEMLDELPDVSAWREQAQSPLALSALRDLIARRVASSGPITLTPGQPKAVALIGPTGVGKTTTIAKLAAHFALVQKKRVALLTVDTYRIAAVEQLKTYSQIIDLPIAVAYSQSEVLPAIEQFADYDLILIDTAGRSQKNIMQVGELKSLLETIHCETHLVLSAHIKEQDMLEAAQRFSAARVDHLIFSKLDETSSYGTLLNVADRTGIPLSYLTTGQKVPEDLEIAEGSRLAGLILDEN
jgi:flagellar biosynthesis protein FlhF